MARLRKVQYFGLQRGIVHRGAQSRIFVQNGNGYSDPYIEAAAVAPQYGGPQKLGGHLEQVSGDTHGGHARIRIMLGSGSRDHADRAGQKDAGSGADKTIGRIIGKRR